MIIKTTLKPYFLLGLSAVFVVSFIFFNIQAKKDNNQNKGQEYKTVDINIGQTNVRADVSDTESKVVKGLSGRKNLGDFEGMLFVFDRPGNYGFWMKDMNFPIDIIWLDQNKKIVFIKKDILPSSFPEVFYPNSLSSYVLEVVSGFSEKNNVKIGDQIYF